MNEMLTRSKDIIMKCKSRASYLVSVWLTIIILTLFFFQYEGIPKKVIVLIGILASIVILQVGHDLAKSTFFSIIILGLIFSFISPVFDIPDEDRHMSRSMYLSEGHLGLSDNPEKIKISKDFDILLQNKEQTYRNNLGQYQHSKEKKTQDAMTATSTYSFVSYIPQAMGWGLGRLLNFNLFWSFYLGRIFNLICYALMVYLALRMVKYWQVPLAVISMFPMVIYLAASYNQDGFTMGLTFIIVSMFINFLTRKSKIRIVDIVFYTLLCSLMATCKLPYALLIGLLIFIKPERFSNKKTYISAYIAILFLALVMIAWFMSFTGIKATHRSPEVNPIEQVKFMMNNLDGTFKITMNALINSIEIFPMNFTFGWLSYGSSLLTYLYLFYMGGIFLFFPVQKNNINFLNKIGIVLVSLAIMTAIVLSQYVTWTPVGVEEIRGVQGRYFIGLFLLIPLVMNSTSLFLKTYDQKLLEYEAGLVLMNKEEKIAETKNLKIVNASQNVWLVAINSLFVLGMILLTLSVYYKG